MKIFINFSAIKLILFTFIFLMQINPVIVNGQSKIAIGPQLGYGVRMLTGNKTGEVGISYQIGASSSIKISEHFNATPGIYYSLKGYYSAEHDFLFLSIGE